MPGHFKVIRHVREKHSCVNCAGIVQAPAPSRPIERGLPGPGLLAHVVAGKYCYHQPLYRQSEVYGYSGVPIDRSTLTQWVGAASSLVSPLVQAIRRHVLSAQQLHADDTPLPVLDPGRGAPRPVICGLTCAMNVPGAVRSHPRCGLSSHPTAKAHILGVI